MRIPKLLLLLFLLLLLRYSSKLCNPKHCCVQAAWLPSASVTQAPAPATPQRAMHNQTPVGGELEENLTRAQRKNQRRAERKAQLRVTNKVGGSIPVNCVIVPAVFSQQTILELAD